MKNTNNVLFSLCIALSALVSPMAFAQTADTVPPADVERAPTIVASGNGQVKLQWDVATDNVGVSNYKIYYSTTSLSTESGSNGNESGQYDTFVKVGNVNETVVTGLTNGTKYYFAVTALDAAGNESEYFSPEAEATPTESGGDLLITNSNANTETVTNTNSTMGGSNENINETSFVEATNFTVEEKEGVLSFQWTPSSSSTMVDQMLYMSKDGGVTYDSGVHMGTSNTYTLTTYDPDTSYTFKLTVKDNTGTESRGVTTTLTTKSASVLPSGKDITNLAAKFEHVFSKYTVTLSWTLPTDIANIVSQMVYQSLDGTVFSQLANLAPTITTYQVKDLPAGKYFFKITTKDKEGNESAGVIKMVELPASGPAVVLISLIALTGGYLVRKNRK